MTPITAHLEYLLQHHDCVILPGIGALIASRHAAVYSEAEGRFLPPMREICFNPAVSNDDGLLANSIARKERIPFTEARQLLQTALDSMQGVLSRDGELTLGRIGILSRDGEGTLSFRPLRKPEEESARMGLAVIDRRDAPWSVRPVAETADTTLPEAEISEETADDSSIIRREPGYYYMRVRKSMVHAAACLAVLTVVALSFLLPSDNSRRVEANVLPVAEIAKPEAKPAVEAAAADTVAADTYHLIVASFRTQESADKFRAQHSESEWGLQTERTRTMWLVGAASSASKETLLTLSTDSAFRAEYPESWVWKKR